MEPYPDCNHHDCYRYGNRLARPWAWLGYLTGAVAGLAVMAIVLLSTEAVGLTDTAADIVDIAFFATMLPLVLSAILLVLVSHRAIDHLVQLMAVAGLVAYIASLRLVSDHFDLLAKAGAEADDLARYFWLAVGGLPGLGPAIGLFSLYWNYARESQNRQQQLVAGQCPNSHDSPAVAVG